MKKGFLKSAMFCSLAVLFLSVSGSIALAGDASKLGSAAIVSLSVNDVGGSMHAGSVGNTPVAKLMSAAVNDMVNDAENKLGAKLKLVKAATFINNAEYRKIGVEKTLSVYVPQINGTDMPVFTQVSKEIKGGVIDAEKAKALCKALKVEGVVVIFSEWGAKTGSFVPTTKALTKNILTVWDSNGNNVFKKRVDMVGNKSLGVGLFKAVNEETIGEWRDAYNRALEEIVKSL